MLWLAGEEWETHALQRLNKPHPPSRPPTYHQPQRMQDDGALQPVSTGKRPRGILGARFLVTPQDENSGASPLRAGGFQVARYGRLEDEQ